MAGLTNAGPFLGVAWSSDASDLVEAHTGLYGVLGALDANDLVGLRGTKACCSYSAQSLLPIITLTACGSNFVSPLSLLPVVPDECSDDGSEASETGAIGKPSAGSQNPLSSTGGPF